MTPFFVGGGSMSTLTREGMGMVVFMDTGAVIEVAASQVFFSSPHFFKQVLTLAAR